MNNLIESLCAFAKGQHDDYSIVGEVADELEKLYNNQNLVEEEAHKLRETEETENRLEETENRLKETENRLKEMEAKIEVLYNKHNNNLESLHADEAPKLKDLIPDDTWPKWANYAVQDVLVNNLEGEILFFEDKPEEMYSENYKVRWRNPIDETNFADHSKHNITSFAKKEVAADANQILEKPKHLKQLHELEKENMDLSYRLEKNKDKDKEIYNLQEEIEKLKKELKHDLAVSYWLKK